MAYPAYEVRIEVQQIFLEAQEIAFRKVYERMCRKLLKVIELAPGHRTRSARHYAKHRDAINARRRAKRLEALKASCRANVG